MRVSLQSKTRKAKKCRVPECGASFVPQKLGQAVCSPACAIIDAPRNQAKARKALAQVERSEIKVRKERLKSRSDHMKDTQTAFNAWVRERDVELPCISCGRHHQGKYDAGHYRTVGSNPALRFEPMNCHRQCSPCNTQLSGNIVNYRIELVKRIGIVNVEWLEGPHEPQKYTIEELKAITAKYRALTRELKKGEAA
ncbi:MULTISPECIES: recombination protein NinG [Pseudomonas syringae group]|uniref:Bacteriophage lambda NinG n=1 Tax=Pseudomonas coronafaciens pv. striafaciens TaxID=235276 RepID=A0A3M4YLG0_9PSED|nr:MULTISPECIES: recombination protein NinG [Pseudomonas syringae group]MDP5165561.1 recombination protein NinG [Pseudomonas syringae pv. aptata str. DSM 50252]RMO51069.1 Bacteriophage lambda NinG [Pseudomonas syringae]RMR88882.1 Bacteriophage lambda NinG [Pseudomonas coronafaciens pv. striafaciens]